MVDVLGTNRYYYTVVGLLATEDGPFASDTVTNYYSNSPPARGPTALDMTPPTA
jgi:hypothetical protein